MIVCVCVCTINAANRSVCNTPVELEDKVHMNMFCDNSNKPLLFLCRSKRKQVEHCSLQKDAMIVLWQKRLILRYIDSCSINLCHYLKGTCIYIILLAFGTTLTSVLLKVPFKVIFKPIRPTTSQDGLEPVWNGLGIRVKSWSTSNRFTKFMGLSCRDCFSAKALLCR